MIREELAARNLPELFRMRDGSTVTAENWPARRAELLDLLSSEEYGYTPEAPESVRVTVEKRDDKAFEGKAFQETIRVAFDTPNGEFSFPFELVVPYSDKKVPLFVQINFRPEVPDKYQPTEEILDNGFAIASFWYLDVTSDDAMDGDYDPEADEHRFRNWFRDGIAWMYPRDEATGWGKIGMWAFAASRVLDALWDRPEIDRERVAVCGHSRLGKTALWCAAQDERFAMAISNDSGCSGAAITREKRGERIAEITRNYPYWLCGKYRAYCNLEDETPFDQHFLVAAIAPRAVYIGSAMEDDWADPQSEFLCAAAASDVWEMLGKTGFVTPDEIPTGDCILDDGTVAYQVRPGTHFFSRA